jgi:hypothetical protein
MFRVVLDTQVLAVPVIGEGDNPAHGKARFETYVQRLLDLELANQSGVATMLLSRKAEEILFDTASYPLWESLRRGLEHCGLADSYQAKDIVMVVDGFLKHLARIEDVLGIAEILIGDFDTTPKEHLGACPPEWSEARRELLLLTSLMFCVVGRSACGDFVVTDWARDEFDDIGVSGRVLDWDLVSGMGACNGFALPLDVNEEIVLCRSWRGVSLRILPINVWKHGTTLNEYEFAFRIFLIQYACRNHLALDERLTLNWVFGKMFTVTAMQLGFVHEEGKVNRLLSAMADTVLSLNLSQTHHLRESAAATSSQQMRGTEGAWRRNIDYEFHLHYWLTTKGPEFAAVVVHNSFDIPW